jgi:hypothetical protein
VKAVPPLLHGYVDVLATIALIVLPFAVGFSYRTNALAAEARIIRRH